MGDGGHQRVKAAVGWSLALTGAVVVASLAGLALMASAAVWSVRRGR
jgi:hypothetical protein